MKHILFVEDDKIIAKVYTQKLTEAGFEVSVAEDGLVAIKWLMEHTPDLVILDLLMPRLTGVDVLKFMRNHPVLKETRVVVFSNSFLGGLIEQLGTTGVEKILVKSSARPDDLVRVVNEVIQGPLHPHRDPPGQIAGLVRDAKPVTPGFRPTGLPPPPPPFEKRAAPVRPPAESSEAYRARMRAEFAKSGSSVLTGLRVLYQQFLDTEEHAPLPVRLEDVFRKLRFLTQMAAAAEHEAIARLGAALEALVFELQEKTPSIKDSTLQTVAASIGLLTDLFNRRDASSQPVIVEQPRVLVVDDDAVTNRALVIALSKMRLSAESCTDGAKALDTLRDNPFDVVLLDIELPDVDGVTLCEKLRALPGHRLTPVIFVTSHDDSRTRARSLMIGGTDFITKPVIPVELGVKVVTLLLSRNA